MNLVGKSTAEQCRMMGWVVGDTIEGREECGEYWSDSRLTILFIGQKSVVFFERSRNHLNPDEWVDYGETADWILTCREWVKIESAPAPQNEALELAGRLDWEFKENEPNYDTMLEAAAELRRQHAHIAEIEGQRNELVDSVCSLEGRVAVLEHFLRVAGVKNAELELRYQWLLARSTECLLNTNPKTWGHCTDADILARADDAVVEAMGGKPNLSPQAERETKFIQHGLDAKFVAALPASFRHHAELALRWIDEPAPQDSTGMVWRVTANITPAASGRTGRRCLLSKLEIEMNDRELLELAAKAGGIRHIDYIGSDYDGRDGLMQCDDIGRHTASWSPLTDDGDALRLAVKMRLHLDLDDKESAGARYSEYIYVSRYECGGDINAAARCAIVCAAAEIGKSMIQKTGE